MNPIAAELPELPKQNEWSPSAFFARRDRLVRLCLMTSLSSLLVTILSLAVVLFAFSKEVLFLVLDPAGNVFVVPGKTFDHARELHTEQAILATSALLLR